jgi:hypothetical protein
MHLKHRGDEGWEYFFKMRSFQGHRSRLQIGSWVKFIVEKCPDPSKKDIAIFIEEELS